MDPAVILHNLLTAPPLFFCLGIAAALIRSDLEIPNAVSRLLSIYLLTSIGLKGGVELAHAGFGPHVLLTLGACVALAMVVPLWTFAALRPLVGTPTAAAVAATYGSVSAVTFIIATNFLNERGVSFGGHMVAGLAIMESPAIVVGILLARRFAAPGPAEAATSPRGAGGAGDGAGNGLRWGALLHEATCNGAVVLLVGSLLVGLAIGPEGFAPIASFAAEPFTGILCLFLLDMGLVAARRFADLRRTGWRLIAFGLVAPPLHACVGIAAAALLRLEPGDAVLLAVLAGSASYIAVPAAMRLAVPEASPSTYTTLALAVTFPFNVIVGIPLYMILADAVL